MTTEAQREYQRKWRAENADKVRESNRKWRANNRDKVLENGRKWRANNPDKVLESSKKQREIRKTDRSKMASVLLAKTLAAKKRLTRTLENNLTTAYIQKLLEKQNFRCAFTGIELDHKTGKNNLRLASIDRINSKKGYVKGNVQIVLNCMNKAKGDSTDKQFRKLLKEIKG
jgi:hypothetical protein